MAHQSVLLIVLPLVSVWADVLDSMDYLLDVMLASGWVAATSPVSVLVARLSEAARVRGMVSKWATMLADLVSTTERMNLTAAMSPTNMWAVVSVPPSRKLVATPRDTMDVR